MTTRLQGKVALVTGAGRGTGRSFALALAREGADVVLSVGTHRQEGEAVARDIEALGRNAIVLQADLGKLAEVHSLIERAIEGAGKLDVLVNNAGIYPGMPLLESTEEHFDRMFEVNVKGLYFATQLVARHMVSQGIRGSIINISTAATRIGIPGLPAYVASKGAVEAFTRTAAAELGEHGIRVNTIQLGLTRTEGTLQSFGDQTFNIMAQGSVAQAHMVRRLGRSQDYDGLLVWLASDESSFCTGSTLLVDGGLSTYGYGMLPH